MEELIKERELDGERIDEKGNRGEKEKVVWRGGKLGCCAPAETE